MVEEIVGQTHVLSISMEVDEEFGRASVVGKEQGGDEVYVV